MSGTEFTILGCGSSGGVPRLGNHWGDCDPANPKNTRRRCSALLTKVNEQGAKTRVLIDTSPDMRSQLLDAQVGQLDGVLYTHAHADHVNGIDDLRMITFNIQSRVQVWADPPTRNDLLSRFGYIFEQPEGSDYPPIADLNEICDPFTITGSGGALHFTPLPVQHGNITSLGFRIKNLAYIPDLNAIAPEVITKIQELDTLVIDALRYTSHPSHFNLAQALELIEQTKPKRAVLTNLHIDMDYETLAKSLPPHVVPAFDMMTIPI